MNNIFCCILFSCMCNVSLLLPGKCYQLRPRKLEHVQVNLPYFCNLSICIYLYKHHYSGSTYNTTLGIVCFYKYKILHDQPASVHFSFGYKSDSMNPSDKFNFLQKNRGISGADTPHSISKSEGQASIHRTLFFLDGRHNADNYSHLKRRMSSCSEETKQPDYYCPDFTQANHNKYPISDRFQYSSHLNRYRSYQTRLTFLFREGSRWPQLGLPKETELEFLDLMDYTDIFDGYFDPEFSFIQLINIQFVSLSSCYQLS